MNKPKDTNGPRQDTHVEYGITFGHRISLLGNLTKGSDLEEDRQDDKETNQTTTERMPSGKTHARQIGKKHAEAFAPPWEVTAAAQ